MTDDDQAPTRRRPPHPADLPCIDPDCRNGAGRLLCQRCSARIERARREHRLRHQKQRSLFQPDQTQGTP